MHPFQGSVEEVPLARSPLVRTLCQVRFPRPLTFSELTVEAARAGLADRYPVAREKVETVVALTSDGVTQQPGAKTLWTVSDVNEEWQITLAEKFVAIETKKYTTRDEFIQRATDVLNVVHKTYTPPVYDRIGVRYINRIEDADDLASLRDYVRPIALAGLEVPTNESTALVHSITESVFSDRDSNIQSRWGWLPAGATVDPSLPGPPVNHWILDIDVFSKTGAPFDPEALARQARESSEKSYLLFRWIMTEEFIEKFRG